MTDIRVFAAVGFFAALILAVAETAYFGWNLTPQSPEEIAADATVIAMMAISVTAYAISATWRL